MVPSYVEYSLSLPLLDQEGWLPVGWLGLAFVLSALIGLEREVRQKSAGLRTHTLVGVGAALFMLVSKYGFFDVLMRSHVQLDPSRIAAQIVTGIGFIGAGLIFVKRDSVHGLTTAAGIWVTAAIGAAAGAGMPILAALTTVAYFLVAAVFLPFARHLPRSATAESVVRVSYPEGSGVLREILRIATEHGFGVTRLSTYDVHTERDVDGDRPARLVEVAMTLYGKGSVHDLAAKLSDLDSVHAVAADDVNVFEE